MSELPNPEIRPAASPEADAQRPDRYMPLYKLSRFVLRSIYDVQIEGEENILDEPAIYAANHVEFADSLLMSMVHTETTDKPMRFVVKQEYLDGKGVDDKGKFGRSVKWFMETTWQIPVDRESNDPSSVKRMLRKSNEAKNRGESTGIHPGGTRIDAARGLDRFNDGVGMLAISAKEPVVPTMLKYEKRPHWYSRIPVIIRYGDPVMPEDFALLPDPDATPDTQATTEDAALKPITGKDRVRRITSTIEQRVADMLEVSRTGVKSQLRKYRK